MKAYKWVAILLTVSVVQEVAACTCGQVDKEFAALTKEEQIKFVYTKADVVLRGRVVRAEVIHQRNDGGKLPHLPRLATDLIVTEVHKGPRDIKRLLTFPGEAACQGPVTFNTDYLYFAEFDEVGNAWTSSCFYIRYVYSVWGSNLEEIFRRYRGATLGP